MPSDEQGGSRPSTPRIPPLAEADRDDQARELLAQARGPAGQATNIFDTLVRHPGLFRKWLPFGGKLLAGKIPARERELLILRTGWHTRAPYEWHQHVRIALAAGVTEDEIERVKAGPDADGWSPLDALLLRAADELHDDACITDVTWAATRRAPTTSASSSSCRCSSATTTSSSFTLNSLGVQIEDGSATTIEGPA